MFLTEDRTHGPNATKLGDVRLPAHERTRNVASGPTAATAGPAAAEAEIPTGSRQLGL